jgi:hypothetical protein
MRLTPKHKPEPAARVCGKCRLCCKTLPIDEAGRLEDGTPYEFHKPAAKWCEHAWSGGCSVYGKPPPKRPIACHTFTCLWLAGCGREQHRPDKSRVIATAKAARDGTLFATIDEDYPGASKIGHGRAMRDWLRDKNAHVVAVNLDKTDEVEVWLPYAKAPRLTPRQAAIGMDVEHDHAWIPIEGQEAGRRCPCGVVELDR